MKAKFLLPLSAAAILSMTACTVTVTSEDDESSSSEVVLPPSSSSEEPDVYSYTSRINDVSPADESYCNSDTKNAGANGYIDAYYPGFGAIAVTVNQLTGFNEKITEIKLDDATASEFSHFCNTLTVDNNKEFVYSSCNESSMTIVVIENEASNHMMNSTTMGALLKDVCDEFDAIHKPQLLPIDAKYTYESLTFCEIYEGATTDTEDAYKCDDIPLKNKSKNTVDLKDNGNETYTITAYFGDEEEYQYIDAIYTLVGYDEDNLGTYWEFDHKGDGTEDDPDEVFRIYGPDFAVSRAKDNSYYYSWSNVAGVYKKIAKKFGAKVRE